MCLPYSRLLTGIPILAVFQNLRWNSNKTSLRINENQCTEMTPMQCIFQYIIPSMYPDPGGKTISMDQQRYLPFPWCVEMWRVLHKRIRLSLNIIFSQLRLRLRLVDTPIMNNHTVEMLSNGSSHFVRTWEMLATFWLEAILTPMISFAGVIGKGAIW